MPAKHMLFRADAREKLLRGATALADAVRVTLGPRSKSYSRLVTSRKEKAQIATISAHNDSVLGELVADAMEKIGAEGVITVEEARLCPITQA